MSAKTRTPHWNHWLWCKNCIVLYCRTSSLPHAKR